LNSKRQADPLILTAVIQPRYDCEGISKEGFETMNGVRSILIGLDWGMTMFSVAYRQQVSCRVLEWAESDPRVVAGASIGSLAHGAGDRWSDLDLTFAVADGVPITEVLEDWTGKLVSEFDAIRLFDLPSGSTVYRVFLLPGCLQFDLSFAPTSDFGAIGPKFRLLFGSTVEKPHVAPPAVRDLFGYAVHHALRGRLCIERDRRCQAEYWISAARDYGMSLACVRRGLSAHHGRGFDDLPAELRDLLNEALVTSLEKKALLRALGRTIELLLQESAGMQGMPARIQSELLHLSAASI
jgi:hypothetical protein